jgi:hypothetical protein
LKSSLAVYISVTFDFEYFCFAKVILANILLNRNSMLNLEVNSNSEKSSNHVTHYLTTPLDYIGRNCWEPFRSKVFFGQRNWAKMETKEMIRIGTEKLFSETKWCDIQVEFHIWRFLWICKYSHFSLWTGILVRLVN